MKKVLITGAGGVLGSACVQEFLKQGYHVIATVSPGKTIETETNAQVSVYPINLTDESETQKAFDQITEVHPHLDAALLLVGGFSMGALSNTDGTAIKKMIALNFETAYYLGRSVFEKMCTQKNGGRIIMVGAQPVLNPKAATSKVAYSLSKSLIFRLAEIFNEEGKEKNVVTTVIVPSIIDTETNRKSMPKANPKNWVTAEQIATLVAFATSEKADPLRKPIMKIYGNS